MIATKNKAAHVGSGEPVMSLTNHEQWRFEMATSILPSIDVLQELLVCDTKNGKLYWKVRSRRWFKTDRSFNTWNSRFSGKEAFTATLQGYKVGSVNDVSLKAHRVIWALTYGLWPDNQIDHIDGDRSNNRVENLREATSQENRINTGKRSDNNSGYKGVWWSKQKARWVSEIKKGGIRKHLGFFDCPSAAHEAYKAASEELHGEFANHS